MRGTPFWAVYWCSRREDANLTIGELCLLLCTIKNSSRAAKINGDGYGLRLMAGIL